MHPFRYVAPTTIDEAVAVLAEHGERARPLAGGTDLLVQTRTGRFDLDAVVDIKRIPELTTLSLSPDGLTLGAAVPCYQIYESEEVARAYPGLIDAASLIGGIQIQSRASIGGNLSNASPSADGIGPLIVHYAQANIAGPSGQRSIPVEDFCAGPGRSVLGHGEFLVSLTIPLPPSSFGAAYQRFIPRNEMDIAVAGVASSVSLNGAGDRIESARIALAAVGPTPILALEAGNALAGKAPIAEALAEAGDAAASACSPIDDMRGDADYRRELVRVLTRRTLMAALERARG